MNLQKLLSVTKIADVTQASFEEANRVFKALQASSSPINELSIQTAQAKKSGHQYRVKLTLI